MKRFHSESLLLDFEHQNMNTLVRLESLDTSFVNLAALLRYLRQRNFVGRVKVALEEYEADVFLYGPDEPSIWEKNRATGRGAQGKDAMDRLLVRARDPGGMITIYEGPVESANYEQSSGLRDPVIEEIETSTGSPGDPVPNLFSGEVDWDRLLAASGELIAAIERATQSANEDFAPHFRSALITVGDDYPFLDPTTDLFQYASGNVELRERPAASDFVAGLAKGLGHMVNKLADGKAGARFRERVAVEFAVVARGKENAFAEFSPHLDRIAGTRVL